MSSPPLPSRERDWRALLNALPHPAWVVEAGRGVTFVNARLRDLTGLEAEGLLGTRLLDLAHEENRGQLAAHLAGQPGAFALRLRAPDGGWHALTAKLQPLAQEEGGWLGLGHPAPDAAPAGQADGALFRRLAEANPIGVVLGRADGSLPYVNDAYLRTLGVTREDFEAGRANWRAATPPEWLPADERAIAQALSRGYSDPYEKENLRPDGSRVPVQIGMARVHPDGEELVAYVLDLTRHKAAEQAAEAHWHGLHTGLEARVDERTAQLTAERERAEVLAGLGDALQRATSPEDVAALALDRLGPALRASSMLIVRLRGEAVEVLTFWGDLPGAILNFMTRPGLTLTDTPILLHVARTRSALYLDDYREVPAAIAAFPHLACAAEPILTPGRELLGFAVAWRPLGQPWLGGQRDLMRRAASTLSLALERAQAAEERREQALALDAFTAYTELVGSETDVEVLAARALDLLGRHFPGASGAYSEPRAGVWRARVWTPDLAPEDGASILAGFGEDRALAHAGPAFTGGGGPEREGLAHTEEYGASASYPVLIGGVPAGVLSLGRRGVREWSAGDQALFRAVGRGLNLAVERAEVAGQLAAQNAELAARTQALEGFAELARDLALEREPVRLVMRAQDIILSLLPSGMSTYYEPDAGFWRLRSHRGEFQHPALLDHLRAGLVRGQSATLDQTFLTRRPTYHDRYAPGDSAVERSAAAQIGALAALPVVVEGEVRGVLAVALHGARVWSPADRVLLETAVRALSVSLERAGAVQALEEERAALTRRTEALIRSNRDLEQFAYVASHDLQEPLRTVASYTELLEKRYRGRLDARADTYITTIVDGAKRMKLLVEDLLAFSRVRSGDQRLSQVDLHALLDDITHSLEDTLTPLGGEITLEGTLPTVRGDRLHLAQLLGHLLGNALKFRREDVPPRVRVAAVREDAGWHFTVADNGIGIEERYFERIFRVFQRLHVREEYGGAGMGLAVCQQIVERHGGHIWVESVPGEGSTFHFTLPDGGGAARMAEG